MKGRHHIVVQNNRVRYEIDVKRNLTIIRGDSATGKTTLIEMLESYEREGKTGGVSVICEKPCVVLDGPRWEENLQMIRQSIVFIDEGNGFMRSESFAAAAQASDNYVVLFTRESLPMLPYSVEEIYGIRMSGKYAGLKKIYNEFYHLYHLPEGSAKPMRVFVEDSNAGYDFFDDLAKHLHMICESAHGKSNMIRCLHGLKEPCLVIADGAAFGSEMDALMQRIENGANVSAYLPESFEWLILSSGLIDGKRISGILEKPEDYIESEKHFSWERYFTDLLIQETQGTFLQYSKNRLNPVYLQGKQRAAILDQMGKVTAILPRNEF